MRRVRGVVHGPAEGLIAPRSADDRSARRPSIGLLRSGTSACPIHRNAWKGLLVVFGRIKIGSAFHADSDVCDRI
jgi:hypothetical protein